MANLTEKDNLSFVQNIRKRLYIIFLNRRAISTFHKQPEWLKNDVDVIDKILAICENVSDKETILMSSPSAASEMDKDSLKEVIALQGMKDLHEEELDGVRKILEYLVLLPKEMQYEVLSSSSTLMKLSPKEAIISLVMHVAEAKIYGFTGSDGKVNQIPFDELDEKTQLTIALIDNSYLPEMPEKTQVAFANGNPLLFDSLPEELSKKLKKDKPIFSYKDEGFPPDEIPTDDTEKLQQFFIHSNVDTFTEYTKTNNSKLLLDFLKINSNISMLSRLEAKGNYDFNSLLNPIIDEIKKEFKDSGRGEEFEDFLNELYGKFNYDPLNPEKSRENRKLLLRFIKVALNKDIAQKVESKQVLDYLKEPRRDKLLSIVEVAYSLDSKKILEERPNIDIDDIPTLYIFSEKIRDEFSVGDVHNFLTYDTRGAYVIPALATDPKKMEQYRVFSKITEGYFEPSALGQDQKLLAFFNFSELITELESSKEPLSEKQKENLLLLLDDYLYGRQATEIKKVEDLKRYDSVRDTIYTEAIEKTTDPNKIKALINQCFFNKSDKDLLKAVDRERKKLLTEDEVRFIDLQVNINSESNPTRLKEEYKDLSKIKERIIKLNRKDIIKSKIQKHYKEKLRDALISPESAIARFESGEKGITVEEEDDLKIIRFKGADLKMCLHDSECALSGSTLPANCEEGIKMWTQKENATSTISCALWGEKTIKNMGESSNIRLGFSGFAAEQILAACSDDRVVTRAVKEIDPMRGKGVVLNTPEGLIEDYIVRRGKNEKTKDQGPEIILSRREMDPRKIKAGSFGGRLMPTYIYCNERRFKTDEKSIKAWANSFGIKHVFVVDEESYRDTSGGTTKVKEEKNKRVL